MDAVTVCVWDWNESVNVISSIHNCSLQQWTDNELPIINYYMTVWNTIFEGHWFKLISLRAGGFNHLKFA